MLTVAALADEVTVDKDHSTKLWQLSSVFQAAGKNG
jgi:hypothetical protein